MIIIFGRERKVLQIFFLFYIKTIESSFKVNFDELTDRQPLETLLFHHTIVYKRMHGTEALFPLKAKKQNIELLNRV